MLSGSASLRDTLGQIEASLQARREELDRITGEIEALDAAAAALRRISPLKVEAPATAPYRSPMRAPRHAAQTAPAATAETELPVVTAATGLADARFPEAAARRARILKALPLRDDVKCADLARQLDLAQAHVQSDLKKLAEQGLAERVGWGRWKRATVEDVVFSGRDSLEVPA